MKYVFVLLVCLNCCRVFGQQTNDIYDLEFRRCLDLDAPWNIAPFMAGDGGCGCLVDSTEFIHGKHPLVFRSIEMFSGSHAYYRFSVRMSQQLFIPEKYQQLEFALDSRCSNVARGWLKVVALNEKEECLYQDSVQIHAIKEWNRSVLKLSVKRACFFRIEIYAEGDDDWLKPSSFSVDRMRILGDGKNIDWSRTIPVLADNTFECIGSWPESVLPFVGNKRIIALAETVHGDSLIAALERNFIRSLMWQDECKLLLMELPYDYTLLMNLYIQGNVHIRAEELLRYARSMQFDSDFDLTFLNELREYNRLGKEKVYIVGINRMTWENDYLFRYWECVNGEKLESGALRNFLVAGKIMEAMEEFEKNKKWTDKWGQMDIFWFRMALKQLQEQRKIRDVAVEFVKGRDEIMKDNIILMVDSLLKQSGKAVIIGHLLHLNKVNNMAPIIEKSCGYYLSQRFGNDYGVVGILKGEGKIWGKNFKTNRKVLHFLELPRGEEFLENTCHRKSEVDFVGSWTDPIRVGWLRLCGKYASRVLCIPMALPQRMDCFLWVR